MSEPQSIRAADGPRAETRTADLLLNRELSWLEFNRRVLGEAADPSNPPLERLKFLAIFGGNLDEFVMKRIGGLKEQLASNVRELTPDGRSPLQQLQEIRACLRPMLEEQRRLFREEVVPELRRHGLDLLQWSDLRDHERHHLRQVFDAKVYPVLTPLAVDPAHPFPFISNLSVSLAVAVKHPDTGEVRFARVKVPRGLPRWVQLPDSLRFIALEEVIAHHLDRLFPGMEILECHPFRVTRNADVQRDEERADDLLEAIQSELRERRFATVVRLVVVPEMSPWMRTLLREELAVENEDVSEVPGPLGFRDLMQLCSLPLPALRYKPWLPVTHPRLQTAVGEELDIFRVIAAGDLLVHHPYDSFATSVQHFIEQAAVDPQVLAIKQTLYRTSTDSAMMRALVRAAEAGKQVAVAIELKARFDEANNINWATALEEAGAHVAYGVVGLKTHAKVVLVVREERDGLRYYCHLGTGNYNADTAHIYTDLGLFTCRQQIGEDVAQLFNFLTGYMHGPSFQRLLVAPINMRSRFRRLIDREVEHQRAGRGGRIVAKMNSLEDPEIVHALYAASAAGVEIDLIVRGICRLRPGLPGQSETIRVRSIVGRFLEHARIFSFGNGGAAEYYIGSADWMGRNLDYRVEAIAPVEDPELQGELQAILDLQLADDARAWELLASGSYRRLEPAAGAGRSSHQQLMERAAARPRRPLK